MTYSHYVKEGVLFLRFSGDLIGENHGPEVLSLVSEHIQEDILFCAIDISGLRYINSSGIGILITILTKFRNRGGEVVLIKPSRTVEKLLYITKLNAIFSVAEDERMAAAELKKVHP
jgi:anti-sigma B factor antagonist